MCTRFQQERFISKWICTAAVAVVKMVFINLLAAAEEDNQQLYRVAVAVVVVLDADIAIQATSRLEI
jgi:hypothetical protein